MTAPMDTGRSEMPNKPRWQFEKICTNAPGALQRLISKITSTFEAAKAHRLADKRWKYVGTDQAKPDGRCE
jgi:hypothetical protein